MKHEGSQRIQHQLAKSNGGLDVNTLGAKPDDHFNARTTVPGTLCRISMSAKIPTRPLYPGKELSWGPTPQINPSAEKRLRSMHWGLKSLDSSMVRAPSTCRSNGWCMAVGWGQMASCYACNCLRKATSDGKMRPCKVALSEPIDRIAQSGIVGNCFSLGASQLEQRMFRVAGILDQRRTREWLSC